MSQDQKDTEIKEASSSGDAPTTESPVAEKTVESSGSKSSTVSEELLGRIADVLERNSEATANLHSKLSDMESRLNNLNKEFEAKKPLEIKATVTGTYDYKKKQKEIEDQFHIDQRERARKLFDRIDREVNRY